MTPDNLHYVKSIVSPQHNAIIVSAVGREFPTDDKTTDLLIDYYNTARESSWDKICAKYRRLAERNSINVDVDELLYSAKSRARSFSLDYCKSLGEELSAKIVAKYLNANYAEAEQTMIFGKRKLNEKSTFVNLKRAFSGGELTVMGGFYGGCDNGRKTFSRGGSDVTGAYVAAAADAELYENWTDVYGVCAASPVLVPNVQTIPSMSYDEMRALSLGGAEVLHPDAVLPVQRLSIPIKIGNFFNPQGASTLVCNCASRCGLLSIAEKRVGGKTVVTVLHNYPIWRVLAIFSAFFRQNLQTVFCLGRSFTVDGITVYGIKLSVGKAELTLSGSAARKLYDCFVSAPKRVD